MDKKAIELYIHIPFCVKKCDYCDFLSFVFSDDIKERYVEALINEISSESSKYSDRVVTTIFIGGGTPSSLSLGFINRIMESINEFYNVVEDAEITIECNPGTITREKLEEYKSCGINRLSIGLQSADDDELKLLGRIHDYKVFLDNFNLARACGFDNINIDLISGLPGQTVDGFMRTLNKVIDLRPEHISSYSLIIEEGTPFFDKYGEGKSSEEELPAEEVDRDIYHKTRETLEVSGYHQYEISNYSLPGYECKHNIGYWTRVEYVGFGIGAASLYENIRWNNIRDIHLYMNLLVKEGLFVDEYINRDVKENIEQLSMAEQMKEYMFLGLRMNRGVCLCALGDCERNFEELFGKSIYDVEDYRIHTDKMMMDGLLVKDNNWLRLTDKGMDLANYVMSGYC